MDERTERFPIQYGEESADTDFSPVGRLPVTPTISEDPLRCEDPVMQISGTGHWFLEGWIGDHSGDPSKWKVPVLVSNFSQETIVVNPFTEVGMITQVTAIQSVADATLRPQGATRTLPRHLQDLVEQTCQDLDYSQRHRLAEVLSEYSDIFPVPGAPLTGHTDAVEHDINTGDRPPIRCAPRRMSPQKMKKEEECVAEMLTGGQIEASDITGGLGVEERWRYPVLR